MNRTHVALASAMLALGLTTAAVVGHAQSTGRMQSGHNHGAMSAADHEAKAAARLDQLKAELQINAAQEPAWQAFVTTARQRAQAMQAMHAQMRQAPAGT